MYIYGEKEREVLDPQLNQFKPARKWNSRTSSSSSLNASLSDSMKKNCDELNTILMDKSSSFSWVKHKFKFYVTYSTIHIDSACKKSLKKKINVLREDVELNQLLSSSSFCRWCLSLVLIIQALLQPGFIFSLSRLLLFLFLYLSLSILLSLSSPPSFAL